MVHRHAIQSNIRRGRFYSEDVSGSNQITIIKPTGGKRYRVFNSGRNAFAVLWGANQVVVKPRCSLDFQSSLAVVKITTAAVKPVKRSYDLLDGSDWPRNGRFQFPDSGATHKPITNCPGIYRIFNSHDQNPFAISVDGGSSNLVSLKPGSSIDIQLADAQTLQVNAAGPSSGSYVLISETDGRSGIINGSSRIAYGLTSERHYRIFKSGNDSFDVDYGDGDVELGARCSIDAAVNGSEVNVDPGTGFYEIVRIIADQRSGRCTFEAQSDGEVRRIIGRARPRFYRVLNSGDDDLEVLNGSASRVLKSKMSLDFVPAEDTNVEIKAPTAGDFIEAIYDELHRSVDVKSGRFYGKIASTNKHTVIDVAQGGGPPATYRFLNSGEHAFQIWVHETEQLGAAGLRPGQSFDLRVEMGANLNVSVSRISDVDDPEIDGIYEYVNRGS